MALIGKQGRVTYLRVNAKGSGYGPPNDFIDVEVVIKLDTSPNEAYGFQLRSNNEGPARQAMLELLRYAFEANCPVSLDVYLNSGKKHGIIHRVMISR